MNEDDNEDKAVYIQPNIEHELDKVKRQECRDIVQAIKEHGVNQRQLLFLINLLAMELENGDVMRSIVKACGEARKSIPAGNRLVIPGKS